MRIRLIAIGVLILTFCSGVLFARIYNSWNVQFVQVGSGGAGMCSTGIGKFDLYESYDGKRLSFSTMSFESNGAARECFDQTTSDAEMTVIVREPLYDRELQNIVGERVVGEIRKAGTEAGTIMAWDGTKIFEISSTSLRHSLIFEEHVRKY
jgi:hypothetical protein